MLQVENYRTCYGHYWEAVLDDPIYGTRDNRHYIKQRRIRFAGRPLSRSNKITEANSGELKQLKIQKPEEYLQRIPIEGKFIQRKSGICLHGCR